MLIEFKTETGNECIMSADGILCLMKNKDDLRVVTKAGSWSVSVAKKDWEIVESDFREYNES